MGAALIGLLIRAYRTECAWCKRRVVHRRIKNAAGSWLETESHRCVTTTLSALVEPSQWARKLPDTESEGR